MRIIYLLDLIVLIICIYRARFFASFMIDTFKVFKTFNYNFGIMALLSFYAIWLFLIVLIFRNFLLIALYLSYRLPRVRSIKNNSRYEVIDNIDYFRDRFKNITPSEISLLTDLEIEGKKDFAASVLDLYNRKLISFDKKKLIINNYNENDLKESEKLLISILQNKNYNPITLKTWKDLCTHEAVEDNLIIEKEKKPFGFISRMSIVAKWFLVLIVSALIAGVYIATPHFRKTMNDIDTFSKKTEKINDEDKIIELIKTDDEFRDLFYRTYVNAMPLAILGMVAFISIMALLSMPIYLRVRRITYRLVDKNDKYERTSEGKILVEQIAGMKNFIHDFSKLSDNEKESVILWNDFLVYAVLLEENDKIVKDIFNYKKADIGVLELVDNNIDLKGM